eukprot:652568-Pyramimonas_sp.AAC.1
MPGVDGTQEEELERAAGGGPGEQALAAPPGGVDGVLLVGDQDVRARAEQAVHADPPAEPIA